MLENTAAPSAAASATAARVLSPVESPPTISTTPANPVASPASVLSAGRRRNQTASMPALNSGTVAKNTAVSAAPCCSVA